MPRVARVTGNQSNDEDWGLRLEEEGGGNEGGRMTGGVPKSQRRSSRKRTEDEDYNEGAGMTE
eukprot:4766131-Pyramimonas_sp.AAC.1